MTQEEEARLVLQQLLLALDYCHRLEIVNIDIKLDNVLLSSSKKPAVIKMSACSSRKGDTDTIARPLVGTDMYTGTQSSYPPA